MSKTINQLKSKISSLTLKDQIFKSKLDSKEKLDKIIMEAIKNTEVGSTILVDTKNYLLLVLSQLCSNCKHNDITKKTYIINAIGSSVASLARDLTYYTLQNTLASIGITKQYCKVSYYNYQAPIIEYLVKQAKESVQNCRTRFCIEIVVDGDLDTNKTLSNISIVNRIYADLKHFSKHIRKALSGLRKNNSSEIIPIQLELQKVQTEKLVGHLQNNHSLYWS
ncbi:ATP dependent DNA helicase [Gigaspora margarita]|uniref:ATP dependent DNA helicase n=1 Tax=Gigaspora margarita TaxID=4874 RepID=A0A8H4APX9_GIGMA|nr:ATP dependent DNA helicase [Gigaspora margarita]